MHHVFVSSFKKLAGGRHPRSGDVDALLSDVYNCTLKEADQNGKKPEGNRVQFGEEDDCGSRQQVKKT